MSTPVSLFAVTVAGRSFIPSGALAIGGATYGPNPIASGVTLAASVDGTVFDIYATAGESGYLLVAYAENTDLNALSHFVFVGKGVDYPSLSRAEWRPAAGGSLDPYMAVSLDGSNIRVGRANTAGTEMSVDRFGRVNSTAATLGSIAWGAGAGTTTPAGVNFSGGDQWGIIVFTTALAPTATTVFTVTFANPFKNRAPYGVSLAPGNLFAQALTGGKMPAVYSSGIFLSSWRAVTAVALDPSTQYTFYYIVLGGT